MFAIRPRVAEWRDWLTPIALFLAMFAALAALGGDRGYFYRPANHDHNTAQALTMAENLSPRHNFRLARQVWLNQDGGFEYDTYASFPIGGFALIKAAIAPFGDDAASKLLAARVLMLLMFCGAALFAYLAIARIAGRRSVALAAVLLTFSGFYALYYADGVFNEGVMELFGATLAFHGMAVFIQEGRFRQLLVKTCAALFIGWHVYALLLPFIAIGFGGEAAALVRSALSSSEKAKAARTAFAALIRSRYAALAAVAILFGSALLAFNFANEYADFAGDGANITELPLADSILRRFGQTDDYEERPALAWGDFLRRQFYRAGAAVLPYSLVRAAGWDFPVPEPARNVALAPALWGLAATCAALGALALARRWRILTATAILFGFCWAIPMRHNTFYYQHMFEGLPYMGLSLALFAFALAGARRLAVKYLGERVFGLLALAAAALAASIFALSVFQVGQLERNPGEAEREKAAIAEFSAMRPTVNGKRIALSPDIQRFSGGEGYETVFFLADSFIDEDADAQADYAISRYRDESFDLLTPDNRFAFLYWQTDLAALYRAERRWLETLEPAARSVFDVYLEGDTLRYLKSPCAADDALMRRDSFFLHVYPAAGAGEFHGENFYFEQGGNAFEDVCLMTADLPPYPIAAIRTGQYIPGDERIWEAFITPPLDADALAVYEDAYREIIESGEPAARGDFDVYLKGGALYYLKNPCDESDARGRFFLSVYPANERDLPAEMREGGHESLNFTFAPPLGAVFNGKCMASRGLPDYGVSKIETGQWIPGGDRLWDAEIVAGD